MNNKQKTKYALGDNEIAALRLNMVNKMFENSSKELMYKYGKKEASIAIDIGCGPGNTTALLKESLHPIRTIGLDISEKHLQRAKEKKGLDFFKHDVTEVPFPVSSPDVIFSRFVLAHLNNPEKIMKKWLNELADGGVLLCQEDEWASSNDPVLKKYEKMKAELVKLNGGDLYIGGEMSNLKFDENYSVIFNDIVVVEPEIRFAAKAFHLNLQVWKNDSKINEIYSNEEIDDLSLGLLELSEGANDDAKYQWGLRQLVIEKNL